MTAQRADPLFFLDEPKIARTTALVETSLGALRKLDLLGPGHRLAPEILAGFAKLATEAATIRAQLAVECDPIQHLVATDPAARRLADRAAGLMNGLDELVRLVDRLQARDGTTSRLESGDQNRLS